MELEAALQASFPEPGGADRLRALYRADVGVDALGVGARLDGDEIRFAYPCVILVGRKPG
ncbi:uncharacterized protein SOCEGT47_057940 [Sorangium cellulosum]|uniref:Uncharacterized protein n=1 Tax=Sorangium cellulosum TaxID=56 RepID=A0A4P2Q721_SORCE|nr:hypothetical protein [Sorangium cellulosum]AUX25250.1 uncharacterized protein SOCEGT47_057940 [Sorangium cellulosum]